MAPQLPQVHRVTRARTARVHVSYRVNLCSLSRRSFRPYVPTLTDAGIPSQVLACHKSSSHTRMMDRMPEEMTGMPRGIS